MRKVFRRSPPRINPYLEHFPRLCVVWQPPGKIHFGPAVPKAIAKARMARMRIKYPAIKYSLIPAKAWTHLDAHH